LDIMFYSMTRIYIEDKHNLEINLLDKNFDAYKFKFELSETVCNCN